MSEESLILHGLEMADAEGREIDDLTARVIASQWHGGQASALYAFASSGAITHADVWGEVAGDYASASAFDRRALDCLGTYLLHAGQRGPVRGWSDLHW